MSTAFYSDAEHVMGRLLIGGENETTPLVIGGENEAPPSHCMELEYNIEGTANWINSHGFKRVLVLLQTSTCFTSNEYLLYFK